ncbi:hypothetical protein B2G71_12605 [Novosphingobium sp. PC22D]|uniref:FecR family protein n=1 Tax=Novosphingobium sp. PC22D TaxID=1962403 RepID=UPI000BFAF51D|nr:FecR domain-containing protein [Novosphingobium sp. PC22D]PEQ12333.1 hypothetical protein B2G71_12605 [Novosphingobium sp. PC22D]
MNRDDDTILERAAAWHIASERDDMDWAGFTAWLAADPRHRRAYDEIALTDAALAEYVSAPAPPVAESHLADEAANDTGDAVPAMRARRWWSWGGAVIAASLAALAIVPRLRGPEPQIYATGAAAREVVMADGSKIELAPHSRLAVEGEERAQLALEGGAWFEIRHDPSRPMTIRAGDVTVTDIGTSFDIQVAAGRVRVEVAQGEVSVGAERLDRPVRLTAGRGLRYDGKAGSAVVAPVAERDLGEWREGRLTFDMAPLPMVAADLSRYANVRVDLAKGMENRTFSGTLALDDGEAAVRDLAQVMGLALVRDGDGYRLGPPPG